MRRAIAVALLLFVAACASAPLDELAMPDDQLQARVENALAVEPHLGGTRIMVSAMNGVIELSGYVQTDAQRRIAENVTHGVEGVRSVINNIHL